MIQKLEIYCISFGLRRWLQEARQFASPGISITLVGNKADLASKRAVNREEAEAFAQENGLQYVEASAKVGSMLNCGFICHVLCF